MLEDEPEEADSYFQLAWTKGKMLEANLAAEQTRLANLARLKSEAEQRERERQRALLEEQNRLLKEQESTAESAERKKTERAGQGREKSLPTQHTVMRGETLPQIAGQADIYNEPALWPLLYRANRDQIRDPSHIRAGQVLRIPRNVGREEIAEARRYGQEKPLH